jgi:uncharacterized Zn finger protein (UPF0148 family)
MAKKCPKCGREKRDPPRGGGVWCPETDGLSCVKWQLADANKRAADAEAENAELRKALAESDAVIRDLESLLKKAADNEGSF